MSKLIELTDGHFIDPRLVLEIFVSGGTLIIFAGGSFDGSKRIQIPCSTDAAAVALAKKVAADVNSACAPPPASPGTDLGAAMQLLDAATNPSPPAEPAPKGSKKI